MKLELCNYNAKEKLYAYLITLTFNTQVSVTMTLAPGAPVANLSMCLNSVLMLTATEPQLEKEGCTWACSTLLIG